ncbi:SpoIIE family protein phosphatase [Streptomyces griseofuscus]|uniref:SpoIIE family protein phosphatase n=1 Tax=Streptomyces griseofuscus TaxID=146922 RepID=UPI00345422D9
MGATGSYAVYDPVTRRCTLARGTRATHRGDPGRSRRTARPAPRATAGPGGLPFEAAEVDLPEGSLIALYSDGLIQAGERDTDAGLTRLHHTLARPSASSAPAPCPRLR